MTDDFTTVVAVDRRHLDQLAVTMPTWWRHKPSLRAHRLLVIYDRHQITKNDIITSLEANWLDVQFSPWPPPDANYPAGSGKWTNHQRYKMLAGFVYTTAAAVQTPYWLKLDTDVVATGQDDWIDPTWFDGAPAIIAAPWGFTRPADQMVRLDNWVAANKSFLPTLAQQPPLSLEPKPGWSRLRHHRIISWCGFFSTALTQYCCEAAYSTCEAGHLPVPSQDGYMWYCATRLGRTVRRVQMKTRGWQHWSTDSNVRKYAAEAMQRETISG